MVVEAVPPPHPGPPHASRQPTSPGSHCGVPWGSPLPDTSSHGLLCLQHHIHKSGGVRQAAGRSGCRTHLGNPICSAPSAFGTMVPPFTQDDTPFSAAFSTNSACVAVKSGRNSLTRPVAWAAFSLRIRPASCRLRAIASFSWSV